MKTAFLLLSAFLLAILINIPFYAMVFNHRWPMLDEFIFYALGNGLAMMNTFFHEIGHTVFAWFYGYPALPMFDFAHGGGMSIWSADNHWIVIFGIWGALIYGIVQYDILWWRILLGSLLVFNLATVFVDDVHMAIISFMGPGAQSLISAFFITRAIYNFAPRGTAERFLNAAIGFGMVIAIFIDSFGLLRSEIHRSLYYTQKGQHGFGDFDKIADSFYGLSFDSVVALWMAFTILSVTGFLFIFRHDNQNIWHCYL